jgi:hypothetical protein
MKIPEPTSDWDVLVHKNVRRRGFGFYFASGLVLLFGSFFAAAAIDSYRTEQDNEARNPAAIAAGFKGYQEMDEAKAAGFSSAADWRQDKLNRVHAKDKEIADRLAKEEQERAAILEANRNPIERMNLKNSSWSAEGFGSIGMMNVIISNENNFVVKDMTILCNFYAKSGTALSEKVYTIYDTVGPKSSKAFRKLNVGFIDSQSAKAGCNLVSAKR